MARVATRTLRIVGAGAIVTTCCLGFVPPTTKPAQAVPRAKFQAKWQNDVGGGHSEPEANSNAASSWTTFLKMSAAACLALVITLLPLDSAEAARSGGRMGGRMSGMRSAPRMSVPRSSGSARLRSGPNISIGIGSPVISPFGFGGFGYSPFGFGFGGGLPLPVPVPSGPSNTDQMLQNQQVQDERKIDEQNREIAELKKQIAELKGQPAQSQLQDARTLSEQKDEITDLKKQIMALMGQKS
ncbi:unnamed protein product [Symbiodinium sp. CCMP2456]|nr:unnamed protein product [Symbiodinium sp. CCMP2456]